MHDITAYLVLCVHCANLIAGEEAARMVVAEGRKLAQSLTGTKKANLQQLCDDVEQLTYQLSDMCRRGQVSGAPCGQLSTDT